MAYILFIDESGHDLKDSPYEVIAGIAIEDQNLWNLIREVHELEIATFGTRYSSGKRELKARKLLKRKTFRLAKQKVDINESDLSILAKNCLEDGRNTTKRELTALARSKLIFIEKLIELCSSYRCKIFPLLTMVSL